MDSKDLQSSFWGVCVCCNVLIREKHTVLNNILSVMPTGGKKKTKYSDWLLQTVFLYSNSLQLQASAITEWDRKKMKWKKKQKRNKNEWRV